MTAERKVLATFPLLTMNLECKRKVTFGTFILTVPSIFLVAITLLIFWLPRDTSDRAALGKFRVSQY